MADVRLTATNPEDSSVVPVACNAKGELLLEDPQLDQINATSGHFTGNVTLGVSPADPLTTLSANGSAFFTDYVVSLSSFSVGDLDGEAFAAASTLFANGSVSLASGSTRVNDSGQLLVGTPDWSAASSKAVIDVDGSCKLANGAFDVYANGNVDASGTITVGGNPDNGANPGVRLLAGGTILVARPNSETLWAGYKHQSGASTSSIRANGSATFKGDVVVGSRNKQWMIVESNGLAHLVDQSSALAEEGSVEYPPLRDIPSELTMVEEQLQKVMERLRMAPEAGWEVWDGED